MINQKRSIRSYTPSSSLENRTRFQILMDKVYTRSYQNGAKPYPLRKNLPIWPVHMSTPGPRVLCPVLLEKRDLSSGLAYLPHVRGKIKTVTKRIFSETFSRMERFENSSFSFSRWRRTKSEVLEYYIPLASRIPCEGCYCFCDRFSVSAWTGKNHSKTQCVDAFFSKMDRQNPCVHPDTCIRGKKTPNLV